MEHILSIATLGYCVYLKYQLTDLKSTVKLFDRLQRDVNADRHERLQKLESEISVLIWNKLIDENPDPRNNLINFRR